MTMSSEITRYDSLGSFDEVLYVLSNILSSKKHSVKDIENYFRGGGIFSRPLPILGIIELLHLMELIFQDEGKIALSEKGRRLLEDNAGTVDIKKAFIKILLEKIKEDSELLDFISFDSISYDAHYDSYAIRNSKIPLKYSALKNFLIHLGFFRFSELSKNVLIVDNGLMEKFSEEIKLIHNKKTLIQLKNNLERMQQLGGIAEDFILKLEKERLSGHPHSDKVRKISEIDVAAGYDIVSYEDKSSSVHDKFIEVKSYDGTTNFFWSKNEIDVAKQKGDFYYLYLVDRSKIDSKSYLPIIIRNPFQNVFSNNQDWVINSTNWHFLKKSF